VIEKAPIRVGVMCTVGPLRFMPFLAAFRMAHPRMELSIVEGVPAALKLALDAGAIEAAIMAEPTAFAPHFAVRPLYRERFALACPPGHPLASKRRIALADLDGEAYVERANCEFSGRITEILSERDIHVRTVYESEREDWVQMMVMSGAGVALMPEYSILLPGLRTRPVVDPEIVREICCVSVASRPATGSALVLSEAINGHRWSL
jgi:DNA-binding transcriptional LysR family regulator